MERKRRRRRRTTCVVVALVVKWTPLGPPAKKGSLIRFCSQIIVIIISARPLTSCYTTLLEARRETAREGEKGRLLFCKLASKKHNNKKISLFCPNSRTPFDVAGWERESALMRRPSMNMLSCQQKRKRFKEAAQTSPTGAVDAGARHPLKSRWPTRAARRTILK